MGCGPDTSVPPEEPEFFFFFVCINPNATARWSPSGAQPHNGYLMEKKSV